MIVCDREHLGLIDAEARRNAFGRQLQSFEADPLDPAAGVGPEPIRAAFIRAPWIESHGDGVEVLASWEGHPVVIREGAVLACSFHPEITGDSRIHALLMAMATAARERVAEGGRQMRDPQGRGTGEGDRRLLAGAEGGADVLHRRAARSPSRWCGALRGDAARRCQPGARTLASRVPRRRSSSSRATIRSTGSRRRSEWVFERGRRPDRVLSDTNIRELSTSRRSARPGASRRWDHLHAEDDGAERLGRAALERHAVSDQRLRGRGGDEPARLRGLLLRACLVDQPDPVAAWKQAADETDRLADWIQGQRGGPRSRGPGRT